MMSGTSSQHGCAPRLKYAEATFVRQLSPKATRSALKAWIRGHGSAPPSPPAVASSSENPCASKPWYGALHT